MPICKRSGLISIPPPIPKTPPKSPTNSAISGKMIMFDPDPDPRFSMSVPSSYIKIWLDQCSCMYWAKWLKWILTTKTTKKTKLSTWWFWIWFWSLCLLYNIRELNITARGIWVNEMSQYVTPHASTGIIPCIQFKQSPLTSFLGWTKSSFII